MIPQDIVLDKMKIELLDSFEEAERRDRAYGLSKTPLERLAACELLRQLTHGYEPATAKLHTHVPVVFGFAAVFLGNARSHFGNLL